MNIKIEDKVIKISQNFKVRKYRADNLMTVSVSLNHEEELFLKTQMKVEFQGSKYFLLDYESKEITQNPPLYNYTINLIDPTIYMQNIILPSRALTSRFENKKSTYQVLEEYLKIYAPELELGWTFYPLKNTVCQEGVWQTPTLYLLFNDLVGAHLNAVVRMVDFKTIELEYLDVVGREITNYSTINKKSDFENYTDKINIDLTNARFSERKSFEEPLNFITPGGPIIKDNDFILETSFPIDEIMRVEISIATKLPNGSINELLRKNFDITKHVVRKEVYETLLPSISTNVVTSLDYKRNNLFYEKGSKFISGWNYKDSDWVPLFNFTSQAWQNIFKQYASEDVFNSFSIKSSIILIRYKPVLKGLNIDLTKRSTIGNKAVLGSQSEASVDVAAFGRQQRKILNSTGEDIVYIYGRNMPPQLMDYLGDYKISELQINNSSTGSDWMAIAQKNYSAYNLNTSVKAEKRFTELSGLNETVLTNHIKNYNLEFVDNYYSNAVPAEEGALQIFKQKMINDFDFYGALAYLKINGQWFVKSAMGFVIDNALVVNFKAKDNYSMGVGFDIKNAFGDFESMTVGDQEEVRYVDENGEFEKMDMLVFAGSSRNYIPNTKKEIAILKAEPLLIGGEPSGNTNYILDDRKNIFRYKDDRETLAETIQHNFLNNDQFIFYDEAFKVLSRYYDYGVSAPTMDVYLNYNEFLKYDLYGKNKGVFSPDAEVVFNKTSIKINNIEDPEFRWYGWIVINAKTDQPLFAYNGTSDEVFLVNKDRPIIERTPSGIVFDIVDEIYYEFNYQNDATREYEFNLDSSESLLLAATSSIQKIYGFDISDESQFKINTFFGSQQYFNFNINDETTYNVFDFIGVEKNYTFELGSEMYYNINKEE